VVFPRALQIRTAVGHARHDPSAFAASRLRRDRPLCRSWRDCRQRRKAQSGRTTDEDAMAHEHWTLLLWRYPRALSGRGAFKGVGMLQLKSATAIAGLILVAFVAGRGGFRELALQAQTGT